MTTVAASNAVMKRFDVIVVGGGAAGIAASLAAAHRGARVALVERRPRLGGECTFSGCVPSKVLIEAAALVHGARRAAAAGVVVEPPEVDFGGVATVVASTVAEIAEDERDERFEALGIEVVHGEARFEGRDALAVAASRLGGERFVVATGSQPIVPGGFEGALTPEQALALDRQPDALLVVGAGPTGLELAQAFARLGTRVTMVEQRDRLLPSEEPEVGEMVAAVLAEEGIELRLGESAAPGQGATLLAAGRRAATGGLGLERLGVRAGGGWLEVDQQGQTELAHLYAAGDVTGRGLYTHVAAHMGVVAGRNAAGGRARLDLRVVPRVIFTDPEVAAVGLTEAEARERHRDVGVLRFPLGRVDRARIAGRTHGFVKLVTARRRLLGRFGGGELVGATIVGPSAGELIHECALAMRTRAFPGRLAQTMHAYPALALGIQQAAAQSYELGRMLAGNESAGGGIEQT